MSGVTSILADGTNAVSTARVVQISPAISGLKFKSELPKRESSQVLIIDKQLRLASTPSTNHLGFRVPSVVLEEPAEHLSKAENYDELNFIEDAIDRGTMETVFYSGGKERASDNFALRMMELGPRSHLDWFVNNNYPAHVGDIGKDEWFIGFKVTVTPGQKHKWRSR
jgi:hypothetical protein